MLLILEIRVSFYNFEISIHELSKKGILEIHEEFFLYFVMKSEMKFFKKS